MTLSLDGFVEDREGSVSRLYPDLAALGQTQLLQDSIRDTGAVVMGRHAYDMAQGNFTGYEFQVPIFVVTHQAPETTAKGENEKLKFHFVSDGIESALRQAKAAAGEKDVTVIGGANAAQQLMKAGLVDELQIGIMPVLFGQGLRFFDPGSHSDMRLEKVTALDSPGGRTDLIFRVVK